MKTKNKRKNSLPQKPPSQGTESDGVKNQPTATMKFEKKNNSDASKGLVFARKYRPDRFDELVGQQIICQALQNAFAKENLAHAYLLHGPRGVGKTTLARIISRFVNCIDVKEGEPCNECNVCREILAEKSMDVMEIDAASHRGIQFIRELKENVQFQPMAMKKKVYIIDEAHMLTIESFNALLKTLEEPPAHAMFLLVTTELRKIPLTILSRCQTLNLKSIEFSVLFDYLKSLCKVLGRDFEEAALATVAKQARGSIRDMLSFFEQVYYFCPSEIRLRDVEDLLGIIPEELVLDLLAELYALPVETVAAAKQENSAPEFPALHKLTEFLRTQSPSEGFFALLWQILNFFRILMYLQKNSQTAEYLGLTPEQANRYKEKFTSVYQEQLQRGYQHFYELLARSRNLPLQSHFELSVLMEIECLQLREKICRPTLAKILTDWTETTESTEEKKTLHKKEAVKDGHTKASITTQMPDVQPSMAYQLQKRFQGTILPKEKEREV